MEQCLNTAQTPPGWGSAPGAAYRVSTGTIPAGSGPPGAPETTGSAGGLLRGPAPQRQKEREAGAMPWAAGTFSAFWAGYSPPRLCLVPGLAAPGRQAGAVPVTMVSSALPPQGRHGRWMNECARQAVLGYAPGGWLTGPTGSDAGVPRGAMLMPSRVSRLLGGSVSPPPASAPVSEA